MKDKITITLGKTARSQLEFTKKEMGAKDDKEVISAALWIVCKLAKSDSDLVVSLKNRKKQKITELKTLKDFEVNPKSWAGAMSNAGRKYTIDIPELKQIAIMWIRTDDLKLFDFLEIEDGTYHDIYLLKIGLKKMFNITKENLK